MSISQYLWSVARGLQTKVYPGTAAGVPRDALQHSINIVSILANALEARGPDAVKRPASAALPGDRAATDRLNGPAENSAAYGDTGAALAALAQTLTGASDMDLLRGTDIRAMIRWEKSLLDAAMSRMDAVLNAVAISSDDPRMLIDPKALQAFLRVRLSCANLEVCDFRQALGGRSRQTALFKLNNANGGADDLVVQRSLPGLEPGPEFASVAGQFEVLKRLHDAGMKVPKPLCFDAGTKDLGSPFLIVERSHGSVVEPDYWAVPKSPAIAMQLAEQMALLHSQPIGDLNTLIRKSRERSDRQGWLDELNRLAQEWNTLAHWPSVTASAAIAWMRANIDCIEDRQTLVHNDMVFHNVLGEGDRLTATLDWEQISIGHPAEDLGYCYPVVAAAVDWESFLDAYYKAGGPSISKRQIDYFALRGVLRLMIMVLNGGRNAFENNLSDDVLVASAGAYFSQRLLRRFAQVLEAVLDRK